jgi:2-dehydro-3-deoxyphosphogluconate aldolase / (4S)-4-hydroxy-2-oxoglutarate aldolase
MNEKLLTAALSQKILPAVTFYNEEDILPVTEALVKAGLRVLEIPFRTAVAEKAVKTITNNFPGIYVGAGTLLTTEQVNRAVNAGAQFGLSPGFNQKICAEASKQNLPFIPGVMTPSEIEVASEMGYHILKLFPAEQIGGISFLKAMAGPYEQLNVQFIPMGGVNAKNLREYTSLKNVIAVGGSWLATKELMMQKNYEGIEENTRIALEQINKQEIN